MVESEWTTEGMEFRGRGVYLPEIDVLSVSDLHVGIEKAAIRDGTSMPTKEAETLKSNLLALLGEFQPSTVVFDGDVHHEFGGLGDAGDTIQEMQEIVVNAGAEPVFVEGNHDTMLDSVVETEDWWRSDDVVFVHGDRVPADMPQDAALYVVGHDHPAVEIEMQKIDCYLLGPCIDGRVLMTPAFNELVRGVVVNKMTAGGFMSPFVRPPIGEFQVIVEDDGEVHEFPPMSEFRHML